MTLLGILLFLTGAGIFGLLFTGNAPAQLAALDVPIWAWLALAAFGLFLVMMNRRTAN